MRLDEDIWNSDFILEVWPLSLVMRVFIAINVEPRPAIERAFFDMRGVFERYVISDLIALVDCAPQLSRGRLHRQADAVPQASRKNLLLLTFGSKRKHICAALFRVPSCASRLCFLPSYKSALDLGLGGHVQRYV